jgi:hypothetical protein
VPTAASSSTSSTQLSQTITCITETTDAAHSRANPEPLQPSRSEVMMKMMMIQEEEGPGTTVPEKVCDGRL